jgi:hypothetical protein
MLVLIYVQLVAEGWSLRRVGKGSFMGARNIRSVSGRHGNYQEQKKYKIQNLKSKTIIKVYEA